MAGANPAVVARLLERRGGSTRGFSIRSHPYYNFPALALLPAGQVRQPGQDLGAWTELVR